MTADHLHPYQREFLDRLKLSTENPLYPGNVQPTPPTLDQELQVLQHALGLTRPAARGHRNHFATGGGTEDHAVCVSLTSRGMMERFPPSATSGGDDLFIVTRTGIEYAKAHTAPAPAMSRARRRYQAWLDADCGMTFGQWLRSGR